MIAIGSQRHLFDVPAEVAYFNTAYNGPLLNSSRDRLEEAARAKSHPWLRLPGDFFDAADRLRWLAAQALGATPDDWAIIPAASYGLSAAARMFEPALAEGDRILLLEHEFPSNVLPWQRAAAETGASIQTVATPCDGDWTATVLSALRPGVRVAALSHAHWMSGAMLDLVAIGQRCREVGAALVVDATQSLGATPFDFAAIDPDVVVAAGYKWLLCPYGFGLMYVAPRRQLARPLEESWLAREGATDFAGLAAYNPRYRSGARRFDVGEACVGTILSGAIAALQQLHEWGVAAIAQSLAVLNADLGNRLEALGFALTPALHRAPHMFGAALPDDFDDALLGSLGARHIYLSRRGASLRFAPHLHVVPDDVARLVHALSGHE